jgi:hypothetical protein
MPTSPAALRSECGRLRELLRRGTTLSLLAVVNAPQVVERLHDAIRVLEGAPPETPYQDDYECTVGEAFADRLFTSHPLLNKLQRAVDAVVAWCNEYHQESGVDGRPHHQEGRTMSDRATVQLSPADLPQIAGKVEFLLHTIENQADSTTPCATASILTAAEEVRAALVGDGPDLLAWNKWDSRFGKFELLVHDALVELYKFCDRAPFDAANRRAWTISYLRGALETLRQPAETNKRRRMTKAEAEVIVRQYLKKHRARAKKGEVGIREIVQETGVPQSSVDRLDCWRALQDQLEKHNLSRRTCRRKAVSFSGKMEATVADSEQALGVLINEQAADYEPSPIDDRGRRSVKCRKKF